MLDGVAEWAGLGFRFTLETGIVAVEGIIAIVGDVVLSMTCEQRNLLIFTGECFSKGHWGGGWVIIYKEEEKYIRRLCSRSKSYSRELNSLGDLCSLERERCQRRECW